jgi:hypothetical protein
MSARKWIALTLLTTLAMGGGAALLNVRQDIYGLFRDTHGRRLPIYGSERRGKYLLSMRYVPENFEAIFLGSSLTSNWNTAGITAYRTYNESTDGGNLTEQKLLAKTALGRSGSPKLKVAICIIHPFMTDSHGLNAAEEMKPSEVSGALGSTSLLQAYKARRAIERGRVTLDWDAFGTEYREDIVGLKPLNPVLTRIMKSDAEIQVDEVAFREYAELLAELRRQGVRVVPVVPPTMEELIGPRRSRMTRYSRRILALFSATEPLVDFDAPQLAPFRRDRANFRDGVHLSSQGAAAVIKLLDARLLASK